MNVDAQIPVQAPASNSFGYMPRSIISKQIDCVWVKTKITLPHATPNLFFLRTLSLLKLRYPDLSAARI